VSVRPDGRIFEALALAKAESAWGAPTEATKRLVATLLEGGAKRSPLDAIMLFLACERLGIDAPALLRETSHVRPADVPTAAFLLQLRAARGGDTAEPLRFLLSARTGPGWRTTIESAWAVLGLVSLLDRPDAAEAAAPGRLVLSADGIAAGELQLPSRVDPSFDGRISVQEPPRGWGDRIVLRLSYEGRGTASYTATLEGLAGAERRPPVERGLKVRREILVQEGNGWKAADGPLPLGRPALVRLTVSSTENRDYVMVTDPRPDGFEPLDRRVPRLRGIRRVEEKLTDQVDLTAGWEDRLDRFRREARGDLDRERRWAKSLLREILDARRFASDARMEDFALPDETAPAALEHRDDRTIFFLERAFQGDTDLYYFVRPELAGRMNALPPRAEPMYDPEVFACGTEEAVEVGLPKARTGRRPELPPGVAGLRDVIERLERVDADELISRIPARPRIGELLAAVMEEPAFRAWLSADAAVRAAGPDLPERIEAARRDLATRALAVEGAREEWLPHLEAAIESAALARLVFEKAEPGDPAGIDNVLPWILEDRAFRFRLVERAQALRGSAELQMPAFRPLSIADVIAALGPKAPAGDALVRWKLSQRSEPIETLRQLVRLLESDLGVPVKLLADDSQALPQATGPISLTLKLGSLSGLFYRIKDGTLWIGPAEELLR
jgi:hypothetical protein